MTQPQIKSRCGEVRIGIQWLQKAYKLANEELAELQKECDHDDGNAMADRTQAGGDGRCKFCGKVL